MNSHSTNGFSRRDLLKGSVGTALALGCFTTTGLRAAIREAKAAGKPLLVEPEINRMIPPSQNRQAYLGTIDFMQRDLLGYLTTNFHLTQQQVEEVRSIPREDLMKLSAFLDRAKMANRRISVRIVPRGEDNLIDPNAVFIRIGLPIQSRSVQEAEEQPVSKGVPSQERKKAEVAAKKAEGKVLKVMAS